MSFLNFKPQAQQPVGLSGAAGGLFSTTASFPSAVLPQAQNTTLPSTAGGVALSLHQQQYLESMSARVQGIEQLLTGETPAMVNFVYSYDPTHTAAQKNAQVEAHIQATALQNPMDGTVLLSKWRRACSRISERQSCVVLPIRGMQQLTERVSVASQATQILSKTLATVVETTNKLVGRNQQMRGKLDLLRQRHASLSHEFIKVVNLIEKVAVSRGAYERNERCQAANAQLLGALEKEFPWSNWQQRIDVMRVWLATLERTGAIATGYESAEDGPDGDAWLDRDQEEGLVEILTAQTEAVEGVTQSLANTEHQVERLEGVIRKNRTLAPNSTS
ncbi:nucleoporin complex subunit 54 [Cystoisospora suis]|uniref:Nucleoporin complex subunit 54 n=1 Tax=Cystoisospora suis TaxID=483139 RepID=A0A2C6KN24_9APIC|nr:nucleoporin complex subunit 54 [Cystoisospora suis]